MPDTMPPVVDREHLNRLYMTQPDFVFPVQNPDQVDAIPPGKRFRGPDGQVRTKPHDVTDDAGYQGVPPGAQFFEGGELKRKPPAVGGFGIEAQTLYDMAETPAGKRAALAHVYGPETVKEDRGELYVDTPQGRLAPNAQNLGGLAARAGGAIAGRALPTGLGMAGAALGGVGGAAAGGPPGAIAGGAAGAGVGGAIGQGANDMILRGMGVESLPASEVAKRMGIEGGIQAGGSLLGAALPMVKPMARAAGEKVWNAGSGALRKLWDVDPLKAKAANEIAEGGGRVPLETWAPGSTFLSRTAQIARGFGYNPIEKAAPGFYEPRASKILGDLGVEPADRTGLTTATSAVSVAPAGEAAVAKSKEIIDGAIERMRTKIEGDRSAKIGAATDEAQGQAQQLGIGAGTLAHEAETLRATAAGEIDKSLAAIQKQIDDAPLVSGGQPGDLMRAASKKLQELRKSFGDAATAIYNSADKAAGGNMPNVESLHQWAADTLEALHPAVGAQYSPEYKILARLAGKEEGEETTSSILDQFGQPVKSTKAPEGPEPVTFGQLHELRNWVRSKINYTDMAPGPKQGAHKVLAGAIDAVLNDASAHPALQEAAAILKQGDVFYRGFIRKFEDKAVEGMVKSGEMEAPENAARVAQMAMDGDNSERTAMLRKMLGPELWGNVQAADMRAMMHESADATGAMDPVKFAGQIAKRFNNGTLAAATSKAEATELMKVAQRIQSVYGKFDMQPGSGDTVATLMQRADAALEQAKKLADIDPFKVLREQTQAINRDAANQRVAGMADIKANPLYPTITMQGEAAANKILSNPDLIRSAAAQFGETSPEFTQLRQAWARQFFQRDIRSTVKMAGELTEKTTDDIQSLLFPGVSKDEMLKLTKQMHMMFGERETGDRTAMGMAGMSWLFNPQNAAIMPHWARAMMKHLPTMINRPLVAVALGGLSHLASSPALLKYVTNGLDGAPEVRDAALNALRQVTMGLPLRAAGGAAAGSAVATAGNAATDRAERLPPPSRRPSMRDRLQGGGTRPAWMDRARQRLQAPAP